jgi:DUF4097 and DUF4098 domain-containing protein YvlB
MRFMLPAVERQKISNRIISNRVIKTFPVGPGGLLNLKTNLGSIHVTVGETSDVCVELLIQIEGGSSDEAARNLRDLRLTCAQDGNDVEIHSEFHKLNGRLSVEFRISVPRNYNVKLKTGAGNISVDGMEGETGAETSGGRLSFKRIVGHVTGRTAGGNIDAVEVRGSVSVHTSGGSISIEQVKGGVVAQTAGGSIRVEDLVGEIEATTKGGTVAARLSGAIVADCYLTTSGGKVIVELNQTSAFDIDAETRAGSIVTEFPIIMQGKLSGSSCKSSINGGGPKLILRSSAGDIHIRKL